MASPDIHLMGAEAQVGVQDQAGGQVVVLAQLSGCHSVWPHGAPQTMLPQAESGEGLHLLQATQKLYGTLSRPSVSSSTHQGAKKLSVQLKCNKYF